MEISSIKMKEISSSSEDEDVVPDDVDQTRTRTRTSDSDSNESTSSNVSFKSNQSKEDLINFKGKHTLLRVPLKHKASTGSNCSSIKTDRSNDFIIGNKRCLRKEVQKKRKELEEEALNSDESTTSNVSFKSDQSKDIAINFKGERSPIREEMKAHDSDSDESTTSNVSFKSDRSKEEIITFRERRSPLREEMQKERVEEWLKVQTRTGSFGSNVSIKSDQSKEDVFTFSKTHSLLSLPMECYRPTFSHELSANVRSPQFRLKRRATTGSICLSSEMDCLNERKRNKSLLRL